MRESEARRFDFPNGEYFYEPTDWVEFIKLAITGRAFYPAFGVNLKYDYDGPDRRLDDLYKALTGTGAEVDMADATLRIIETGTTTEMFDARLGPFEEAPNAFGRILALVRDEGARLRDAKIFRKLFEVLLLSTSPRREAVLEVLRDGLSSFDDQERLEISAARDFEWFVANLPLYRPEMDPVAWIYHGRTNRFALLEALQKRDRRYVDRVIASARGSVPSRTQVKLIIEMIAIHPVFAAALAGP